MSKSTNGYNLDTLNKIFDAKEDYVIIRIGERSGEVSVFSIDDITITHKSEPKDKIADCLPLKVDQMGLSKESKGIEFIDAAFWYKGSPICVIHGNKRY